MEIERKNNKQQKRIVFLTFRHDVQYLRELLAAHTPYPVVDDLDLAYRIFGLINPSVKKQLTDRLNELNQIATPRDCIIQSAYDY